MEKKPNLLHIRKKKIKIKDPCPVCDKELHYNNRFSRRVGIFDTMTLNHSVIGWACPYCETEFDKLDNIVYIYGQDYVKGKT